MVGDEEIILTRGAGMLAKWPEYYQPGPKATHGQAGFSICGVTLHFKEPSDAVWRVYWNGASMEEGAELGGAQSPREKSQCVGGWREENCISGFPRQGWWMEEERVQWGRHLPWTANSGSIPSLHSVLQTLSVTRAHRVWPRPLLPLPNRYSRGRTGNMGVTKAEAGTLCF